MKKLLDRDLLAQNYVGSTMHMYVQYCVSKHNIDITQIYKRTCAWMQYHHTTVFHYHPYANQMINSNEAVGHC